MGRSGLFVDIADGELVVRRSVRLRQVHDVANARRLDDVTFGKILIDGRDVTALPPKDRNIAMVFQNYALYPQKTVFENMAFGLRVRRTPQQEIDRRRSAASSLGLRPCWSARRQLSGGQM